MSTTSDDSREAEQSGRTTSCSAYIQPPFSNLAVTVEQVNRIMDLGNPVSCWSRQTAWVLTQPTMSVETPLLPNAVRSGALEAVNLDDMPQTMVGTIVQMSMLLEQMISLLSSGEETKALEVLVSRYRHVEEVNMVTLPWQAILEGRMVDDNLKEELGKLLMRSVG